MADSCFNDAVKKTISLRNLNFQLKELQLAVLKDVVMFGKDVLTVLPTGYGKTVIYSLLPTLNDTYNNTTGTIVVIVSPLVALMEDHVVNIEDTGIRCVYASKPQTPEVHTDLESGSVPIIMISPEALFHGEWRQLFTSTAYQTHVLTIVIDEAHCVEQWGDEFRTDYGRLAELRSILPKANMLALTATASPSSRISIMKKLCMEKATVVVGDCDRSNIILNTVRAPYDARAAFTWLIDCLKDQKQQCPKTVIYCRSIKSCAMLFKLFTDNLGNNAYNGMKCAQNRLFAMYHHSTTNKCKKIVSEEFPKVNTTLRVVIATSAFGMGVNVPDIRNVIHWGASRSMEGFMQEFGRSGRDGEGAMSILYFHGMDISKTATDDNMRTYALATSCRRAIIREHFTPDVTSPLLYDPKHLCCDFCQRNCECSKCPELHSAVLSDLEENAALESAVCQVEMIVCHSVSEKQRITIREKLLEFRRTLAAETTVPCLLNIDIMTGLSDKLINCIVSNAHYISSLDDLLSEYIFDRHIATSVMDIIDEVLAN